MAVPCGGAKTASAGMPGTTTLCFFFDPGWGTGFARFCTGGGGGGGGAVGFGADLFFANSVIWRPLRVISSCWKPEGRENERMVGRWNDEGSDERRHKILGMPSEMWVKEQLAPSLNCVAARERRRKKSCVLQSVPVRGTP